MSDAFVRDLRAAAQAGVPIVCVVTHEERRAVDARGRRRSAGTRVHRVDGDPGLERRRRRSRARSRRSSARARGGETGVARVMLDVHPWLSDARVVRALRDLAAVKRDVPLVLVMPVGDRCPPELDRDARVLAAALPGRRALGARLSTPSSSTAAGRATPSCAPRSASPSTRRRARSASRAPLPDPDEALQRVIAEKRGRAAPQRVASSSSTRT